MYWRTKLCCASRSVFQSVRTTIVCGSERSSFMAFLDHDTDTPVCYPSRVKEFPGDVSNLVPISSQFYYHVLFVFSYRLKFNLLLENCSMCL